jgi:hypothetical protein
MGTENTQAPLGTAEIKVARARERDFDRQVGHGETSSVEDLAKWSMFLDRNGLVDEED